MKRRKRYLPWVICAVIACGMLIASVVIGERIGDSLSAMKPRGLRIREAICGYVRDNRDRIMAEFEMMQPWSEKYAAIYEMDGSLYGIRRDILIARQTVNDEAVTAFVRDKKAANLSYPAGGSTDIVINFEKDGVISVKTYSAGNVTYAAYHGYYYSPNDVPLWVCAEVPKDYSDRTGEYLYHPLVQDGEMWKADIAAIEKAAHESFIDDYYTMRITDNLYYFCYGW